MTLKHFTVLMYLQKFFAEFNPIYPLYALMFVEFGGLTTAEVSSLFFIWFTVALVAEIPTGIVADKISRRYSSLIGRLLLIGTFVGWLLIPNFYGFAFGFVLWGIGFAFTSGATDSYLFDTLKKLGGEQAFTKLYARTASIKMFGMFFGFLLGTLLIPFGYEIVLYTSIAVSCVVPVILLLMPADDQTHMRHRSQLSILAEAWQIIRSGREVFILAAFLTLLTGVIGMSEEYIALYYTWNGLTTQAAALVMTVGFLGAVAIEWTAHYFDGLQQRLLFGLVGLAGFLLYGTSFFFGWVAIIGLYLFIRILKLMETSLTARMHTKIDTDARSTTFSLISFVSIFVAVVGAGVISILQALSVGDIKVISMVGLTLGILCLLFILVPTNKKLFRE